MKWIVLAIALASCPMFGQDENLRKQQERWKDRFAAPAAEKPFEFKIELPHRGATAISGARQLVFRDGAVDGPCAIRLQEMPITAAGAVRTIRPDVDGMRMPRAKVPAPACR